jgi:hypothetical protein
MSRTKASDYFGLTETIKQEHSSDIQVGIHHCPKIVTLKTRYAMDELPKYSNICSKCSSSNHTTDKCNIRTSPCLWYQKGTCKFTRQNCKFLHACSFCQKNHRVTECPDVVGGAIAKPLDTIQIDSKMLAKYNEFVAMMNIAETISRTSIKDVEQVKPTARVRSVSPERRSSRKTRSPSDDRYSDSRSRSRRRDHRDRSRSRSRSRDRSRRQDISRSSDRSNRRRDRSRSRSRRRDRDYSRSKSPIKRNRYEKYTERKQTLSNVEPDYHTVNRHYQFSDSTTWPHSCQSSDVSSPHESLFYIDKKGDSD